MLSIRTCLLSLAGSLLGVSPSSAFWPEYHEGFTRDALVEITRTIEQHELRFTKKAIEQIVDDNEDQDDGWWYCGGPFARSANHFGNEWRLELEGEDASQLLIDRLANAKERLLKERPDGEGARRLLGQALHAVQDYYAHSNRDTVDPNLGVSTFSAVGPETATCEPPPNTGTYVPFVGLTSGYWFGCFGEDDSQLPANKCYHGLDRGFPQDHAGTNRDHEGRTGFGTAEDAARASTRDITNQLLDDPQIAGDLKAVAALMGVTNLAFVVDTTNSMNEGNGIGAAKQAIRNIVNFAQTAGQTPEYLLVRFNDPEIGEPFITTDAAAFLAAVDSLTASCPEPCPPDCPEPSMSALLTAVDASLPESELYLFTDANPNDPAVGAEAIALARERNNSHPHSDRDLLSG